MKLNISELGPQIKADTVTFRLMLPNIDPDARVLAVGTFCNWEMERAVSLRYNSKNHLWEGTLEDVKDGLYEYAFVVKTSSWYSNPSSDPYARMTGKNGFSAFKVPQEKPARLDSFRRPKINELVLYELNLDNFNKTFEGVKKRVIHYLSQLGVNAIMFSPWLGYDHNMKGEKIPVHYFAPDAQYGSSYELKVLINECHRAGIAVIMGIDLHAVSPAFGINQLYPMFDNKPMLGRADDAGKRIRFNYSDNYTKNFFYEVCNWWLDEFNIDGFNFYNTQEYWDGPDGDGFGLLCKNLFKLKKSESDEIFLFAKDVDRVDSSIINSTFANGIENSLFLKHIHSMASARNLRPDFWKILDINQLNYSEENIIDDEKIKNVCLNSIENENTQNLIVKFGTISGSIDALGYPAGDRKNHWWKIKPYIIAQFTGAGVPVIYNGQEICNNRYVPESGPDHFAPRPIGWHNIADFAGKDIFRFHQKLVHLRSKFKAIRSPNFIHYFTDPEHQVIAFKRYQDEESIVIAINFSNESYEVLIPFPTDGFWHEYLDDYDIAVQERQSIVKVPARYGVIFHKKS